MAVALEPDHGSERIAISVAPFKLNAQSRLAGDISQQVRLATILCYGKVQTAVSIEITNRRSALFAIDFYAAVLAGYHFEMAPTIAFQEQTAAGVISSRLGLDIEKVLRQEQVFIAIAV